MATNLTRRDVLSASPAIGLSALVVGGSTRAQRIDPSRTLYRVDDEAKIIAVAKAVIEEDYIATLITIDAEGVPRARSVGVWAPDNDLVLWIGTRRTSRKLDQIRGNPNATIHFAHDDMGGNFANAYYASFMGRASVHIDDATVQLRSPEEKYRRAQWPDFPHDYAAIRFETKWLEVYGKGIKGKPENWQPQAVTLAS
jgi:general stress protein 26